MRLHGALLREQGVTFGIVVVRSNVMASPSKRDETLVAAQTLFPGVPVVLMAQDTRGVPEYYGRKDLVRFLANVPLEAIPWREYCISN